MFFVTNCILALWGPSLFIVGYVTEEFYHIYSQALIIYVGGSNSSLVPPYPTLQDSYDHTIFFYLYTSTKKLFFKLGKVRDYQHQQ